MPLKIIIKKYWSGLMINMLGVLFSILVILVVLMAPVGYIMNIYKFCQCDFKEPYKAEVIRGVGIGVAPVGCVTGWLSIED